MMSSIFFHIGNDGNNNLAFFNIFIKHKLEFFGAPDTCLVHKVVG